MAAQLNRPNTVPLSRLLTAAERTEHRLDRLRELRATIDALRSEQSASDPLLAWVMGEAAEPEQEVRRSD